MKYFLYDIALFVVGLFLVPYFAWKSFRKGRVRKGMLERFGFFSGAQLKKLKGRRPLWIHSVSVGETRAVLPLVRALRKEYPQACLLVSTVTETGREVARKINEADLCLYFPFDLSWVIRRVFSKINPAAVIIVETEIWPNFVSIANDSGIPVVLVNGRLSDHSFPRYRAGKFFIQKILTKFSALCMQTELDGQRIKAIGGPREKIFITGNLKFDSKIVTFDQEEVEQIRRDLKIPFDVPVVVAGSTHEGEETDLILTYIRLLEKWTDLVFILVPRHPGRCKNVGEMISSHGVSFALRSEISSRDDCLVPGEVLLVDTIGEMLKLYAFADIVFVGGSLVPIGGHNILEGSMLKKPVVFGPYMNNFKQISKLLQKSGGGVCVENKDDLLHTLERLLNNAEERLTIGNNGFDLLEKNKGATEKTLKIIKTIMRD